MVEEEFYKVLVPCVEFRGGKPYWVAKRSPFSRVKIGSLAGYLNKKGYRRINTNIGSKSCLVSVHRLHWYKVYGTLPSIIDHINRNPDDNRIENLREVSISQNTYNQGKKEGTSSKYRGVHRCLDCDRWKACIRIVGVKVHLGLFKEEKDAAKAYNDAVFKYELTEYIELNNV